MDFWYILYPKYAFSFSFLILARGQINENFCHREHFASEAGFAACGRHKLHKLRWENAYLRSFSRYNGTVANNYLEYFLVIEKSFVFFVMKSLIKPTSLLHANAQTPWRAESNRPNWWRPECFCKPVSPVTTPKSGQQKLPIRDIHQSYGWTIIHAEPDKSAAHIRTWVFQKAYRRLHDS